LIVSHLDPKHGTCSLTIESADDLWMLRRLIRKGDILVTRSSRVLKQEDEFSRPDKGERVKVTIALEVEGVKLDSSIERLRVRGTIREASDDTVSKSGSHSASVTPGHSVTIRKRDWTPLDTKLVRSSGETSRRFVLVAIDRREAGVGLLTGSHLAVVATVESGVGGKMWDEASSQPFMKKVVEVVKQEAKEGDEVVVAGPGLTKSRLANQISAGRKQSASVKVVEGFDLAGSDGIRALVRFPGFRAVASQSALVEMQGAVEEAVRRISTGDRSVCYTLPRVKEATEAGAVESCIVSDDVFASGVDEQELVDTLNAVESRRGKVFLADSSLDLGKQVSSFGGIIALLRYAFRS
jgi:protein pelota